MHGFLASHGDDHTVTKRVEFERPPIHEIALSSQFRALSGFTSAHVGAIWGRFRERFPKLEEHDPIARATESFSADPPRPQVKLKFARGHEPGRTWFLAKDGHEVVQIQSDRFVRNWRRVEDQGAYPSYAVMRQAFADDLATFQAGVAAEALGELVFDQCEISYVDHAFAGDGFESHVQLDRVIRNWSWPVLPPGIEPERAMLRSTYVLRGDNQSPWARVRVNIAPVYRLSDSKPLFTIETTARGAPLRSGLEGVLAFMDRAHDRVVELFLAVTSEHIQTVWGRRRDG